MGVTGMKFDITRGGFFYFAGLTRKAQEEPLINYELSLLELTNRVPPSMSSSQCSVQEAL
jgi:hypothetical protein